MFDASFERGGQLGLLSVIFATALACAAIAALVLDLPPEAIRFLLWAAIVAYAAGFVAWAVAFIAERTHHWEYEDYDC